MTLLEGRRQLATRTRLLDGAAVSDRFCLETNPIRCLYRVLSRTPNTHPGNGNNASHAAAIRPIWQLVTGREKEAWSGMAESVATVRHILTMRKTSQRCLSHS